jgi:nucleotide-binding universal stress UspA family protein
VEVKRILCPTDFSEASAHAAEQAIVMAGYYHSRITALHVLAPMMAAAVPALSEADGRTIEEVELERCRDHVARWFAMATSAGVPVDVAVEIGEPRKRILARAAMLPADLIVMGTHGTGGFERLLLGSVTERVLRRAACPVLTVPPHADATSQVPFKRILCAVDFSDSSLTGVKCAASLALRSGAALTLVHVLEWPWEEPPPPTVEELPYEQGFALSEFRRYCETSAQKRLESVMPDSAGLRAATAVKSGKPYVQILQLAADDQSDLIVIGVRGRNPMDLTLFGSTTNHVVRRATCPVFTLKA